MAATGAPPPLPLDTRADGHLPVAGPGALIASPDLLPRGEGSSASVGQWGYVAGAWSAVQLLQGAGRTWAASAITPLRLKLGALTVVVVVGICPTVSCRAVAEGVNSNRK